jgi:hypothetical protein
MRLFRCATILVTTAVIGGLLLPAMPAGAAAVQATAAKSWRVAFTGGKLSFTAITAASATSAWAFGNNFDGGRPSAYQLSGSRWKRRSIPGAAYDQVVSAGSTSSSNVWAFVQVGVEGQAGEALRFNGHSWSVMQKFSGEVSSGTVISQTDVWVFGPGGTWHFNGSAWAKSASAGKLSGASALSPSNIWAFGGTTVAHWNGSSWKRTSLAGLIPKNALGEKGIDGIYAASARSVYALGSEHGESVGGPLVLLHYNGSRWSRLVVSRNVGEPRAIIPDGSGGVWIPVLVFILGGGVNHYSHGKLSSAALPINAAHLGLVSGATAPRSAVAFIGGFERTSDNVTDQKGVILRYGT